MWDNRSGMGKVDKQLNVMHKAMHTIDPIFKDFIIAIIWRGVARL